MGSLDFLHCDRLRGQVVSFRRVSQNSVLRALCIEISKDRYMGGHFPHQDHLFTFLLEVPISQGLGQEDRFHGHGFHFWASFGLCSVESLAPLESLFYTWPCFLVLPLKPEITCLLPGLPTSAAAACAGHSRRFHRGQPLHLDTIVGRQGG